MDAHRNVVGEQGQARLLAQDSEVLGHLGLALQGVEGRGRHDHIRAEGLGSAHVRQNAFGLRVDDAGQHRDPAVDDAQGLFENPVTALVAREGNLATRTVDEEGVDARREHPLDVAFERGEVESAVLEGDDERGDDSRNRGVHAIPSIVGWRSEGAAPRRVRV